jgi:hypothetical protein
MLDRNVARRSADFSGNKPEGRYMEPKYFVLAVERRDSSVADRTAKQGKY